LLPLCATCRQLLPLERDRWCTEGKEPREKDLSSSSGGAAPRRTWGGHGAGMAGLARLTEGGHPTLTRMPWLYPHPGRLRGMCTQSLPSQRDPSGSTSSPALAGSIVPRSVAAQSTDIN